MEVWGEERCILNNGIKEEKVEYGFWQREYWGIIPRWGLKWMDKWEVGRWRRVSLGDKGRVWGMWTEMMDDQPSTYTTCCATLNTQRDECICEINYLGFARIFQMVFTFSWVLEEQGHFGDFLRNSVWIESLPSNVVSSTFTFKLCFKEGNPLC